MPAGSSAAALTGSQAAALIAMVLRFALGRQDDEAPALHLLLAECEGLRHELLALADADMAAYGAVVATLAMPKATPAAQTARTLAMQQAFKGATETPYAIAAQAVTVMQLVEPAVAAASRTVASDATTALLLANGAVASALLTVRVNLRAIRDEDFVATWSAKANSLEAARSTTYASAQLACEAALGMDLQSL